MQGNGETVVTPGRKPYNENLKYPPNLAEAYGIGAVMDLKLRFAMQVLSSPAAAEIARAVVMGTDGPPDVHAMAKAAATFAIVASSEIVKQAEEAGLIEALQVITGPELLDALAATGARVQGALQVEGQVGAQAYAALKSLEAQNDGPRVAVPPAGAITLGGRKL